MSTTIPASTVVLDMNPQDATRLMLVPSIQYDNPLQRQLNLYEVISAKNKVRMNHLSKPANVLQPKSNCKTWNPTVNFSMSPDEFTLTDYEVNGEQCPDEFDSGVGRLLLDSGSRSLVFGNTPILNAVEQSMVRFLSSAIVDSIYKVVWFSDPDFNSAEDPWGLADLSHMTPSERNQLTTMLTQQSGVWDEVVAYADAGQIPYVDSNDGTAAGNATNPGNVTDYFDEMRMRAHPTLQFMGQGVGDTDAQRGVYFVQPGIFRAYQRYLRSLTTERSHLFILNGEPVKGVLTYDDYLIIRMNEWDLFDYECGRMHPTTRMSRIQRAIFTVPRNIVIGANMQSIEGAPGSGLILQRSNHIRDKFVTWMYYCMGIGASFAHEQLMVASWNTDQATFAS